VPAAAPIGQQGGEHPDNEPKQLKATRNNQTHHGTTQRQRGTSKKTRRNHAERPRETPKQRKTKLDKPDGSSDKAANYPDNEPKQLKATQTNQTHHETTQKQRGTTKNHAKTAPNSAKPDKSAKIG
jgi:hypothetical protein